MAAKVSWLVVLFVAAQVARAQAASPQKQTDRKAPANPATSEAQNAELPLPAGAIARLGTTRYRTGEGTQAVSFLPDKRTLVVAKTDGALEHWNAQTGRFLQEMRVSKQEVSAAAFASGGRFLAARGMYWVGLYDNQTGQELFARKLDDHIRGELIAIAGDASVIAVGGAVRPVHQLIDLASGKAVDWPMNMPTDALALSPDGNLLAAGGRGLVRVWQWRESKEPRYFAIAGKNLARKADIRSIEFSPDASFIAVGIDSEAASLIDLRTGEETRRLATDAEGASWRELAFSADARQIATPTSFPSGGVAVFDVGSGKLVQKLQTRFGGASSIAFSSDGQWLTAAGYALVHVWNVKSGELLGRELVGHPTPQRKIEFFPRDERIVSSGIDDTIYLWKVKSGAIDRVIKHEADPNGIARGIEAIDISPDGKHLATSSMDDVVEIWQADMGRLVHRLPGHGRLGGLRAVRFTTDSQKLVSWGDDMRVCAWDVHSGKTVKEFTAEPTGAEIDQRAKLPGTEVAFGRELGLRAGVLSDDASRLVLALKAMHVFDVESGRELIKFDYPKTSVVRHLAVSPDNRYLMMVGFGYEYEASGTGGEPARKTIHRAELRQLSDGKLVGELSREDGGEAVAAFSPDSRRAAINVGKDQPLVVIVDVPEMKEIARIGGFRASPQALEFSHSGKLLAVSNADTSIVVYDLERLPK